MLEEILIVALRKIASCVRTTRLFARKRGERDRGADLEHVVELEGREDLGVECPARVFDLDPLEAVAEPRPLMGGAWEAGDPVAVLPVLYHLLWTRALVTDVTAGLLGPGSVVGVKREGAGR